MSKPYFYVYASANRGTIEKLASVTNIPESEVKATRMKLANGEVKWSWSSPYHVCNSLFPEDELTVYLKDSREILDRVRSLRSSLDELAAIIIWPDKNSRGISIKAALLQLLYDNEMSLEMDNS